MSNLIDLKEKRDRQARNIQLIANRVYQLKKDLNHYGKTLNGFDTCLTKKLLKEVDRFLEAYEEGKN